VQWIAICEDLNPQTRRTNAGKGALTGTIQFDAEMHGLVLKSDDARYSMAVRTDGTLRHRFLGLDAAPRGPASLGPHRHLEDFRTDVDD
jgi:hypothetical protein